MKLFLFGKYSGIEILNEFRDLTLKFQFCIEIAFLDWNCNFGSKSLFWIKITASDRICTLGSKLHFWIEIALLDRNCTFGSKLHFWIEIALLDRNCTFGSKLHFWIQTAYLKRSIDSWLTVYCFRYCVIIPLTNQMICKYRFWSWFRSKSCYKGAKFSSFRYFILIL